MDDVIRRYKDRAVFLAVRDVSDKTRQSQTVVALNRNKDILTRTIGVFTKCDEYNAKKIRAKLDKPGVQGLQPKA